MIFKLSHFRIFKTKHFQLNFKYTYKTAQPLSLFFHCTVHDNSLKSKWVFSLSILYLIFKIVCYNWYLSGNGILKDFRIWDSSRNVFNLLLTFQTLLFLKLSHKCILDFQKLWFVCFMSIYPLCALHLKFYLYRSWTVWHS